MRRQQLRQPEGCQKGKPIFSRPLHSLRLPFPLVVLNALNGETKDVVPSARPIVSASWQGSVTCTALTMLVCVPTGVAGASRIRSESQRKPEGEKQMPTCLYSYECADVRACILMPACVALRFVCCLFVIVLMFPVSRLYLPFF